MRFFYNFIFLLSILRKIKNRLLFRAVVFNDVLLGEKMNAVLVENKKVTAYGIYAVGGNGGVELKSLRNPNIKPFNISVKDWKVFIDRVKTRQFRKIRSKPGVEINIVSNVYMILTYHGYIEFKYSLNTDGLTYHMSQTRCNQFIRDIRKGKFDLVN